ncbi:MAG TPA: M50 family metallopeptidase [Gaiellaceae bacterium]|jgi:regulator of sigma E protease
MIWVVVIAGLVAIVFIHELGHFGVALAVGMRPRSFYIGFPPAIVKIKRRGIEYGIGAILLGGFVRLPGMHRPAARDLQALFGPAIDEHPSLAASVRRVSSALAREDYDSARAGYVELEEAVAAVSLSAMSRRAVTRALRDVDEGTSPDAYWRAPTWKRISVIAAGPAANVILAFVILFVVYAVSGSSSSSAAKILDVQASGPAAIAGLRAGDVVASINGRRVNLGSISDAIQSSDGRRLTLVALRHGHARTIGPFSPVRLGKRWIIGIDIPRTRDSAGTATSQASSDLWSITTGTLGGLGALFQSHSKTHFQSIVGVGRYSAKALRVSVGWYFQILALVSMSLALLNLIPLLPLDGGHILFSLIESVRRRALAREVYERASLVGLALIVLFYIVAFHNNTSGIFG